MNFCTRCGKQLTGAVAFCTSCGQPLARPGADVGETEPNIYSRVEPEPYAPPAPDAYAPPDPEAVDRLAAPAAADSPGVAEPPVSQGSPATAQDAETQTTAPAPEHAAVRDTRSPRIARPAPKREPETLGNLPGPGAPAGRPGPGYPEREIVSSPSGPPIGPWLPLAPARHPSARALAIAAAVIVLLAAAGVLSYHLVAAGKATPATASTRSHSRAAEPASPSAARTQLSPSPTAVSTSPPASSLVALGAGVTGNRSAVQVAAFVANYFSAINNRDFASYSALFAPSAATITSARQFKADYGSTHDSKVVLSSLTSTGSGGWAAGISFTSHQSAAESATHTACTAWNITLYLSPSGSSYLIGSPPAGYQATFRAC
jgi:hypothetical protein